jgi:peroxiredoxin Q/BCP
MLRIGDTAPEFEVSLDDGTAFRLSEALEKGPVILYFYPKDFTAGCTREAQGFRDVYSDIRDLGASVIGMSTDDLDSHRRFREACRLPFQLAADTDGTVREAYGVRRRFLGPGTKRVTYLIDCEAVIRGVYDHEIAIGRHVTDVLNGLRELAED